MELHDALTSRRTIQRFRAGAIADATLERALAAAVYAPNHKATWPFRFVIAGPVAREAVFRVSLRLKAAKRGGAPDAELEARMRADLLLPDRLVAVVQVVSPDPNRAEEDYAACACATYALMLALHADGAGTKWGTGGATRAPETLAALGVDPATERIVGFVWIGVPEVVPQTPRRPPLDTLVRRAP